MQIQTVSAKKGYESRKNGQREGALAGSALRIDFAENQPWSSFFEAFSGKRLRGSRKPALTAAKVESAIKKALFKRVEPRKAFRPFRGGKAFFMFLQQNC